VPGRRAQHDRPDRSVGRCVGLCAFVVRIRLRVRSAPSGPNSVPTRFVALGSDFHASVWPY
jgi:hypothetical protein